MNYGSSTLFAAAIGFGVMSGAASAATIASDDFSGARSASLGSNWTENESGAYDAYILKDRLLLRGPKAGNEAASVTTTVDASGFENLSLSFDFWTRSANTDLDSLNVSWTTSGSDDISEWNLLGSFHSGGGAGKTSETLSFGSLADNQNVSIAFWMDIAEGNQSNGFFLDNFVVAGSAPSNQRANAFLAPVPVPAGLPLLLTAFAGLGLMRRGKNAKKA